MLYNTIKVFKDKDNIEYILRIKNYDEDFEDFIYNCKYDYEENIQDTEVAEEISVADYIIKCLKKNKYEFDFVGFDIYNI